MSGLLLLMLLLRLATAKNATCSFTCLHDSECAFCNSDAALGDVELCRYGNDGKGRHCQCKPGWSGFRCAHKHESCYDNGHPCYNGGTCIPGLEDTYGTSQYFCDCSNAIDSRGRRYVGKYCELNAIEPCDTQGLKFCVNNQTCSATAESSDIDFCECGTDYEGPHCEFEKDKVPDCDLKCMNGGSCALGIKNYALAVLGYNDFWANHEEAMHCQCPPGFFGVRCEIAANACGDHHCFNGGVCVALTVDDGGTTYNCDCSYAHTAHQSFAGAYCQYQSSVFCETNSTIEGRDFCVNGGTCKVDEPGCDCPTGFEGPMCEYNQTIQGGEPDCKLSCDNGGVCATGAKDTTFVDKIGTDMSHLKDPAHDKNFEHCICAQGFFGLTCDKSIELCGSGEYVCLNGATCVSENNQGWSCACDQIDATDKRYAGAHCQHEASVYCTPDNKPGNGVEIFSFCTNGGTCKSTTQGDGHTGCNCPPEFKGENCEIQVSANAVAGTESDRPTSSEGLVIFFSVLAGVIAVLAVAIHWRIKVKRRNEKEKELALRDAAMCAPVPTHSTVHSMVEDRYLDFGPERDQEGMVLENVEII